MLIQKLCKWNVEGIFREPKKFVFVANGKKHIRISLNEKIKCVSYETESEVIAKM